MKDGQAQINSRLDGLNALINTINLGGTGVLNANMGEVLKRLGPQIQGGLSGAVKNIFENKVVDRAIGVATLATTIHNGLMLSRDITQTLFSATNNLLNSVGIKLKNEEGNEIGIEEVLGGLLLSFANTLFGAENVATLSANWKKANRIYQAGANVIDSVRSMTDSVKNVAEFTAENTGKIGNSLKTYQVIAPDAYQWMPERVDAQSIWMKRLESLQEAASGIEMVSGELLSITENAKEIKEQLDEFNKGIEDLAPTERKDNKPVSDKKAADKTASITPAVPPVTLEDFRNILG